MLVKRSLKLRRVLSAMKIRAICMITTMRGMERCEKYARQMLNLHWKWQNKTVSAQTSWSAAKLGRCRKKTWLKIFPCGIGCSKIHSVRYLPFNRLARTVLVLVDDVMMPNFTPGTSAPRPGSLLSAKVGGFLIRLLTNKAVLHSSYILLLTSCCMAS